MKTKQQPPPRLGTVWMAVARVRLIDDSDPRRAVWRTVATCIDTPNAIAAAIDEMEAKYPGKTLWVHSDTNGRYIP